MKKIMISLSLVSLLALAVTGIVMAQDSGPDTPQPFARHGQRSNVYSSGLLHDYIVGYFAEKLNIDVEVLNTRLEDGESMAGIAFEQGYNAEEFFQLMNEARTNAIEDAFKDGVITQDQYDFMLEHTQNGMGMGFGSRGHAGGFGRGGHGNHNGAGSFEDCPYYSENAPTS